MKSVTAEEMRVIEENCERLGVSRLLLMENAGSAIARNLKSRFKDLSGKKVIIIAGTGNNGGDGFAAARHLAGYGAKIHVILLGKPEDVRTSEASLNWCVIQNMSRSIKVSLIGDEVSLLNLKTDFEEADAIIDAVFGTGVKGRVREPHSTAIDLVNASSTFKLAVDIPSGLDPTTGEVHDKVVKADVTVTFHCLKNGIVGKEGLTGEVFVEPIGIPPEAESETYDS